MSNQDDVLAKMRKEAEERDAKRKAEKADVSYLDLALLPIETDALSLVSEDEAREAQIAAIETKRNNVVLVAFDLSNPKTKEQIEKLESKGYEIKTFIVSEASLNRAWDFYKYVSKRTASLTGSINIDEERMMSLEKKLINLEAVKEDVLNFDSRNHPTGEILEIIFAGSLANGVSDIHFEPEEKIVRLRYRIDGDLRDVVPDLDRDIYRRLTSRIKLLANLKLNVGDKAQDGRITIDCGSKKIEIRVAIAPSEFGEVIVMRVLDPFAISLSLQELGFRQDNLDTIKTELKRPNGMILNTGPTGSGKTTTLYAFLKHKSSPESKIITIEDPIEYHLDGIEQTQVDPAADYTFANGLRSMMRQDPDIILIGEIRDKETSEIAIQAALTGHLVFSTVHANNAAGAIPRLMDLGVKNTSIGPATNLIIAQRLIKRHCPDCKKKIEVNNVLKEKLNKFIANLPDKVDRNNYKDFNIYEAVGCEKCEGTGYKGRVGIYELLRITGDIEEVLIKGGGEIQIRDFAKKDGMTTMQEDGVLKVINGMTSLKELEKITGPIEELE